MLSSFYFLLLASKLALSFPTNSFPEYRSLAGLSSDEIRAVARTFTFTPGAQPAPPAINDTSPKLVFDDAHPWLPPAPADIRGPCPGLNTLASHGYISRTGVATPGEIITAVQEAFNMGWHMATFITYGAFMVDGNHLTNLLSIGMKTPQTGPEAPEVGPDPLPAFIGGLSTHGGFEGDASMTRGDAEFGNNFSFNETLFDQLSQAANDFGDGKINLTVASVHRHNRILDSMARNPNFTFVSPRFLTAYAEATFPLAFFVSNQTFYTTENLELDDARSFFQNSKFPDNFVRRNGSYDLGAAGVLSNVVYAPFPVLPGRNDGVGNYVLDPEDPGLVGESACYAYYKQSNLSLALYPEPTQELRTALRANIQTMYDGLSDPTCEQVFPFGQA